MGEGKDERSGGEGRRGVAGCTSIGNIFFCNGLLQLVDGVLTEDSDAFLYGACTVYKDLSTNEKVRMYVRQSCEHK